MLFLNKKHISCLLGCLFVSISYGRDDKPSDSLNVNQNPGQEKKEEKSLKISENFFLKRGRITVPTAKESLNLGSSTQASEKKPFELRFSGYARVWGFYRHLNDYQSLLKGLQPQSANPNDVYKEYPTAPTNISLSDGYQEPLALIRIEGNPSLKTWFQMEYYFDHRINRVLNSIYNSINTDNNGRAAAVYRIFQFTGGMHTKVGTFKLTAGGGVNWFKLSPFTLWQYQNRDDLFERYPWEPEGNDFGRYNAYYSQGDIPRDQRWGNQGTQGFIIEATGLPKNFDAAIIYGKNQNSGGFVAQDANFADGPAQNMFAGRIGKKISAHKFGLNMFNQYGYFSLVDDPKSIKYVPLVIGTDSITYSLERNRASQLIWTLDGRMNFDKFKIYTELGAGSFTNEQYNDGLPTQKQNAILHYISKPWINNPHAKNAYTYKKKWSPALFAEVELDRSVLTIPLKASIYHIGEGVVNNTSAINNSSIENFRASTGQGNANIINYYQGMVTEINQYTNNRQGVNIMSGFNAGKLKVSIDYANSQELVNQHADTRTGFGRDNTSVGAVMGNGITFQHRVNQLATSRFGYFERYLGPYQRIMNVYRRTYENVQITDVDSTIDYKKSFNTVDLTFKYKSQLAARDIIFSYYINYNSVQDKFAPIPLFSKNAFLRQFYQEFLTFYNIHPKFTILAFAGYERVLGNNRTELAAPSDNYVASNGQTYNKGDLLIASGKVFSDPNGKSINQYGYGFGLGFDWEFVKRSTLNVRARKYGHNDRNQVKDHFAGHEVVTELKIFF